MSAAAIEKASYRVMVLKRRIFTAQLEVETSEGVEVLTCSFDHHSQRNALEDLAESTAQRIADYGPKGSIDLNRIPEPMRSKVHAHLQTLQRFNLERAARIGAVLALHAEEEEGVKAEAELVEGAAEASP